MRKVGPAVSARAFQRLEIEWSEPARDPVDLQARTARRQRALAAVQPETTRTPDPDILRIALGQRKPARRCKFTRQPRLHPQHDDKARVPDGPGTQIGSAHD